ncbi:MAG: hypothetical protein HC792_01090 [Acaryochloridaceae cyanobacterium CSU_5_19]|nr:hypothetical protein [Acaryochloridaceae cyanobacterium CSU_5_19]
MKKTRLPRRYLFYLSLFLLWGGWMLYRQVFPPIYLPSSPKIAQLALETTMTEKAQQLFYKQDPEIAPKGKFHNLCRNVTGHTKETILLGCFTSDGNQGKIVIQSVTEPRLAGMMEMTAAHEMLHAAYQELSSQERQRLSPRLKQAVQRVKDANLLSVLKAYAAGDPEIYLNELHSHLGTTLSELGDPVLEKHYRQYFQDRQQVVAFAQRSRSVLASIETQVQALEPQLNALESSLKEEKDKIQRAEEDLKTSRQTLEQMQANLTGLKQQAEASFSRGNANLVAQYEQARSLYNAEVENYNWQVQSLQNQVTQFGKKLETYNQKVEIYNGLAAKSRAIIGTIQLDSPEVTAKPGSP